MLKPVRRLFYAFLGHIAKKILHKYDPQIVGITGSVGKTSTKEVIFEVLKDEFNVRKNIKNYNSETGVPLTIIGLESPGRSISGWLKVWTKALGLIWGFDETYPEVLVLEMAADHPGDIQHLVKVAPCKVAVITAVGASHLEFFGDTNAVAKEKEHLVSHLKKDATAIINRDDEKVHSMVKNTDAHVLTYGFFEEANIRAHDFAYITHDDGSFSSISFKLTVHGQTHSIKLKNALARTFVYSYLSAVAVGISFGISVEKIIEYLKDARPPKGRMHLIGGIKRTRLIDDTYNSSPKAAEAALEVLAKLYTSGKKVAVLGDMLELGAATEKEHIEIGKKVFQLAVDMLITVGEKSKDTAKAAISAGMNVNKVFSFDNSTDAGRFLQEQMEQGDLVLIKGSQGSRMEKITKEVMAHPLKAKNLLVRQYGSWLEN